MGIPQVQVALCRQIRAWPDGIHPPQPGPGRGAFSHRNSALARAISRLAARRFTSHSQGPGSVSSKSLISRISSRSGEAKPPKFARCASPHNWAYNPVLGHGRQVRRHDRRRPAVESEGRSQHAPIADGYQLRDTRGSLRFKQVNRVRSISRRCPGRCCSRGAFSRAAFPIRCPFC